MHAGMAGALGIGARPAALPLNVLHINTDQQRFDAMGCAGSRFVRTPNLDRLAREGVRFTHAFTPQPMCVAARCSLHTGLSIFTTHCTVTFENPERWHFGVGSWDQCLDRHGYHCEYHGRWHAPPPLTSAYRNTVDLRFIPPYREWLRERRGDPPAPQPGRYADPISGWPYEPDPSDSNRRKAAGNAPAHGVLEVQYGVSELPPEHTFSGFVADRLIEAMQRLKDKPFSLHGAILHPHHPQQVTRRWAGSVKPSNVPPATTFDDRRLNTPYVQAHWQVDETDRANFALIRARYFELVQEVDEQIGRVLTALDELGLAMRTLVVFTADHGEFLGDHGLTQKFYPYQEAVRVPLLMRLPGLIPARRTVDHPVNLTDVHATILDYLGHSEEGRANRESRSLRPLIAQKDRDRSPYVFSEMANWHAIVGRDWKYVWFPAPQSPDLLFDLDRDPHELMNLLGTHRERARYLGMARDLRRRMLAWMEAIGHQKRDALAASDIG